MSFPSSIRSVECVLKILEVIQDVEKLELRIGIHQGDIMEEGNDIFGDDVNITSRINPYAKVGGIVISDKVYRDISSNPKFKTKFVGKPKLKGVKQEVGIFSVVE